jgi:carbon monoxide dehydrogenase subunit G
MIELRNTFTIPAPLEEAWQVLLDIERIAPCMPGAKIEAARGDEFDGSVKVKLGAMMLTYRGQAKIIERDDAAHRAVIEGSAKEARGSGTAKATVVATLQPSGDLTEVVVSTSLHVTGKPAQFGRGVMAEVSERLIGQFAERLREEMMSPQEEPAAGAVPSPAPSTGDGGPVSGPTTESPRVGPEVPSDSSAERTGPPRPARPARESDEPIDLLAVAGGPVAKRAGVAVAAVALLLLLIRSFAGRASAGGRPALARGATVLCSCGHESRLV